MSHGNIAFVIVAVVLMVLNLKAQQRYTRAFRAPMESTAKSRWLPQWLNPSALTVTGVLMCIGTGPLVFFGYANRGWMIAGLAIFFVGSMLDVLDGPVARQLGKATPFGKFLDSNTDRMGEASVFGGFILLLAQRGDLISLTVAVAALTGGYQVSYAQSSSEAGNIRSSKAFGFARRAERCAAIIAAMTWMAIGWDWRPWIYLVAVLIWLTVGQRWLNAYRETR